MGAGADAFDVSLAGAASHRAVLEHDHAAYGNIYRATDAFVQAVPAASGGVELAYQLRSPSSPRTLRLRFRLTGGATLAMPGAVNGRGGAAVIERGKEVLAALTPAIAEDAQGQPVRVSYSVRGSVLTMHVDSGGSVAWPVLVDPIMETFGASTGPSYEVSTTGSGCQPFGGLSYGCPPVTGYWGFYTTNLNQLDGLAGSNYLELYGDSSTLAYNNGTDSYFWLPTPNANVYIYSVAQLGVSFTQSPVTGYPALMYNNGSIDTGVTSTSPGTQQPGEALMTTNGGQTYTTINSSTANTNNPYIESNEDFVECAYLSGQSPCNSYQPGLGGNEASWTLVASAPNPPGYGYQSPAPVAVMGATIVLESQTVSPTVAVTHTSQPPSGWVKSYADTATLTGSDPGLGMGSVSLSGPGVPNGTTTETGPGTGTFGNIQPSYTGPGVSYTAPEGIDNYTATATDVAANPSTPATWTAKVDDTPPTVNLSGDLGGANGATLRGSAYSLAVDALDQSPTGGAVSGVQQVQIKVDPDSSGNSPYPVVTQTNTGCTSAGCPATMTANWTMQSSTYGDGNHTIDIYTTDAAGNIDTETISFTLMGITPTGADTIPLDGEGSLTINGAPGSDLGASVTDVGDVNGDGLDDYLVGAPHASCDGRTDVGAAYLVYGSSNTAPVDVTSSDPRVLTFCGASAGDQTGAAVAAAGDINGDGYPDLLIGAPGTTTLGLLQPQGRVYVIFGGPNLHSIDLANFATETQTTAPGTGFLILGPRLNLTLNPAAVPFGAQLATRNVGDESTDGDVNGDGLDDIVIGSSGSNDNLRLDSGTVYVIFGKTDGGTIDLSTTAGATQGANQLNPSVNTGFRIFGANLGDQAGQSTALVGSVDQSGYASIVVTAPGVVSPHGGSASGAAYVLFGSASPGDIDLANFGGTTPPAGYRIFGPPGAAITSVAPLGDVNGDQVPDILVGGDNAAWVVAGKSDSSDVYLDGAYNGYEVTAPNNTYGQAQVTGLGDIDGDGTPDTLLSFPTANNGAGSSFVVYGRPEMTNLSLNNVDGSQAARINGAGADQAGTSAASVDGDRTADGYAAAIVGAPGNAEAAAVSSPHLKAYTTHWGTKKVSCEASSAWTYPYPAANGRTLPVCRVGRYKLVPDHSLNRSGPYQPGVSAFGAGNAHKKTYVITAQGNGKPWAIVDSTGNPVAYIKMDVPGCFTVYDSNQKPLGDTAVIGAGFPSTCPSPGTSPPMSNAMAMWMSFIGRGCMQTTALESSYVGFELVQTGNAGTGQVRFEGLQGYISKAALPSNLTYAPGSDLWQAFTGCGPGDFKFKPQRAAIRSLADDQTNLSGEDFPGAKATFSDGTTEFFRSSLPAQNVGLPLSRNQGLSGVLDGTTDSGGTRLPNEGFLFASSSAVQTGDVVRAMLPKNTPFTELDYMTYSDPNDYVGPVSNPDGPPSIVGNCRIAKWVFGKAQLGSTTVFGWMPFRSPVPAACAPANP